MSKRPVKGQKEPPGGPARWEGPRGPRVQQASRSGLAHPVLHREGAQQRPEGVQKEEDLAALPCSLSKGSGRKAALLQPRSELLVLSATVCSPSGRPPSETLMLQLLKSRDNAPLPGTLSVQ